MVKKIIHVLTNFSFGYGRVECLCENFVIYITSTYIMNNDSCTFSELNTRLLTSVWHFVTSSWELPFSSDPQNFCISHSRLIIQTFFVILAFTAMLTVFYVFFLTTYFDTLPSDLVYKYSMNQISASIENYYISIMPPRSHPIIITFNYKEDY